MTAREFFWRVLAKLGFRRLAVFLHSTGPRTMAVPPGVEVRDLERADVDTYCRERPGLSAAEVLGRLDRGHRCVVAWSEGRIVSSRWGSSGKAELPYLGIALDLAEGVEYLFDIHTAPDKRKLRLQTLLRETMVEDGWRAGHRLFGMVLPENEAGVATILGSAARIGTLASVRLGWWRIPFWRGDPTFFELIGGPDALRARPRRRWQPEPRSGGG
jgi:hypothetical protein